MSALPAGGVPLGGAPPPPASKITTYPVAAVFLCEGVIEGTNCTHYLRILLPVQGEEIRIPFGGPALARMARDFTAAAGIASTPSSPKGKLL